MLYIYLTFFLDFAGNLSLFSWIDTTVYFFQKVRFLSEGIFHSQYCLSKWRSLIIFLNSFLLWYSYYILFFGMALFSNSITLKYSTRNHYFANNCWSHCIAFEFAWYCVNCFDYSFLCHLSQKRKTATAEIRARKCYDFKFKQAVIKHTEENSSQEAASIFHFFI